MTFSTGTWNNRLIFIFLMVALLYLAQSFLIPLTIGGILASMFHPVCRWFELYIPRWISVFLCLIFMLMIAGGISMLVIWQLSGFTQDVGLISQKIHSLLTYGGDYLYSHFNLTRESQLELFKQQQPDLSAVLQSLLGSTMRLSSQIVFVFVYALLLLYYRTHLKNFLLRLVKKEQQEQAEHIVRSASRITQQYLVGLSKMIVALWIMYSIGFTIAGVSNPVTYAVLCGFLEIVPFIGNITGTSITLLASAAHDASLATLGSIALTYGIIQFIQGWFLEPLILGPQVRINPLFTIIALVLGGMLWGIAGVFLAIPMAAILKIVFDHIEPLKPYGFLIGEIETTKKGESKMTVFRKKSNRTAS